MGKGRVPQCDDVRPVRRLSKCDNDQLKVQGAHTVHPTLWTSVRPCSVPSTHHFQGCGFLASDLSHTSSLIGHAAADTVPQRLRRFPDVFSLSKPDLGMNVSAAAAASVLCAGLCFSQLLTLWLLMIAERCALRGRGSPRSFSREGARSGAALFARFGGARRRALESPEVYATLRRSVLILGQLLSLLRHNKVNEHLMNEPASRYEQSQRSQSTLKRLAQQAQDSPLRSSEAYRCRASYLGWLDYRCYRRLLLCETIGLLMP